MDATIKPRPTIHTPSPDRRQKALGFGFVGLLSLLAGMTDAIGFLRAGDFFSFMSGNTTRLAIAIAEGHSEAILRLALILGAFVVGNASGVLVVRRSGIRQWPLLLAVGLIATLCAACAGPEPYPPIYLTLVLAMGMLNAAVESVAGHPLGLTYVTGALSRFGRGVGRFLCGERHLGFGYQILPWGGMLVGAIIGALLLKHLGEDALWCISALALVLAAASFTVPYHWVHESFGLGRVIR
ncbi:DUF1275 domain-containing protein [Jiella sp. MQZ9-1]|uniref:DUF1275 domain-containing protein n=1 Tax=Jiella flava TaxID=2816857 RepID=A0A939G0R2_9HYPH|nr:YoaK family protein [Jiella flava]MBO0663715.1 DUF1275 domain-containing protein [Jiella flava]MCD2472289.1 DUF1275 domain-containing protein [Jiella flava]